MQLLDLTLKTPEENLALDEALLEEAEIAAAPREILRVWESREPLVVLGRSSQAAVEVNLDACRRRRVSVLRRLSGGAAIVAGHGSLMYAVVLNYELRPALRSLDAAHRFVLETLLAGLRPHVADSSRQGTSDLALGDLKFSGNSVRCKRGNVLYHGTLLYDFELPLVEQLLLMPPRQPEYRRNRSHHSFLTNLPIGRAALVETLVNAWGAHAQCTGWPQARVRELVEQRYSRASWNLQR
jgi:lipoate-protein ligase A